MSASINQFGLHTIEYAIRKKNFEDPLYIAANPELFPQPAHESYAHNTPYDSCTTSSPLTQVSIDVLYADQLSKNKWSRPMDESPSMYKTREGEWFDNPKLRHTLEVNSPYVPYAGFVHPRIQTKWEDSPQEPPEITKSAQRERYPVVLSSMTKYVEEMNMMENGFKLY